MKCLKEDRRGGEKIEGDRTQETKEVREMGDGDTGKTMKHKGKTSNR